MRLGRELARASKVLSGSTVEASKEMYSHSFILLVWGPSGQTDNLKEASRSEAQVTRMLKKCPIVHCP